MWTIGDGSVNLSKNSFHFKLKLFCGNRLKFVASNYFLVKTSTSSAFSISAGEHMSIIPSCGMLVKGESRSALHTDKMKYNLFIISVDALLQLTYESSVKRIFSDVTIAASHFVVLPLYNHTVHQFTSWMPSCQTPEAVPRRCSV